MSQTQDRPSEKEIDDVLGVNLDNNGSTSELPIPKRKKINNLNESHFLQNRGLPYLRKNCEKSIKPRIQHKDDYKNLTNILNFYQLWGHSIYPKANFKDFLEMTTKVGIKSPAVKLMREKFITEDMDKERQSLAIHLPGGDEEQNGDGDDDDDDGLFGPDLEHISQQDQDNDDDDDDQITRTTQRKRNNMFVDEDDEENYKVDDDLYSIPKKVVDEGTNKSKDNDSNKDQTNPDSESQQKRSITDDFEDEFDDDLDDDLLAESKTHPTATTTNTIQQNDEIPLELLHNPSGSSNKQTYANPEEDYQDEWDVLGEIGQ